MDLPGKFYSFKTLIIFHLQFDNVVMVVKKMKRVGDKAGLIKYGGKILKIFLSSSHTDFYQISIFTPTKIALFLVIIYCCCDIFCIGKLQNYGHLFPEGLIFIELFI